MLVTERLRLHDDIGSWVEKHGATRSALIPVIQEIQRSYNEISEYAMQEVADRLDIHPVEVYSVVSFYSFLESKARGRFVIRLCRTVSCDMTGKDRVARQLPQLALVQLHHPVQPARQPPVMGHQRQARALRAVELEHQFEHGGRGLLVEVAGRLVAEHAGRLVHQRARHRRALALAAGQLARLVLQALAQAD